ncbi:MAG: phosphomannomutase/phosphoglucomutase [Clostridia bacterium]|nr:phosphomannomutase/phosphoglucomutase [Clostridia bacterium]
MLQEPWKHLKSGTDIRGVALEGVEGQHVDLTDEVVAKIASAFALWLQTKTGKKELTVAIGRDSRLSGSHIMAILDDVLVKAGFSVLTVLGMASTPAMFMTTLDLDCDAAIQITASHHPWNRNGLKFFLPTGGLEGKDIGEILELCQEGKGAPAVAGGSTRTIAYMDTYADRLKKLIREGVGGGEKPLEGFHVAVDAGNGAGGFYVNRVLVPLGANCDGSQFLEPDGSFPNHIPNPENKVAMEFACRAVKESGADLGIIFDTDVDRAGCVDSTGREINRNRLVALASVIALQGNEGGAIVTDSITSAGLKTFIEGHLGGQHLRFKRGYKNVINKAIEMNNAGINTPLAIETSGHAALRENYFLDDGAYLATRILIEAAKMKKEGRDLTELISALDEPAESVELRFNITEADFRPVGEAVLARLEAYGKEQGWAVADDSYEGVRIAFGQGEGEGWFLLRLSVHDPVMPLNIESDIAGGTKVIAAKLLSVLEGEAALDLSPLQEFVK